MILAYDVTKIGCNQHDVLTHIDDFTQGKPIKKCVGAYGIGKKAVGEMITGIPYQLEGTILLKPLYKMFSDDKKLA